MSQSEIDETIAILAKKYEFITPYLDERSRRIWATVEATAIGWGGVSRAAVATGMSRDTIRSGLTQILHQSQ